VSAVEEIAGPDWEWYRELAEEWQPPRRCTCTEPTVATLEQTLACPEDWYQLPGGGWAHALPAATP
jgi:hypothetical protein